MQVRLAPRLAAGNGIELCISEFGDQFKWKLSVFRTMILKNLLCPIVIVKLVGIVVERYTPMPVLLRIW